MERIMSFSPKRALTLATASIATLAFAATAHAGDCSSNKTKITAQYTPVAAHTAVLAASANNGMIQTVGYGKKKKKGTIVEAAVATDSLSTLVAAVTAAGLVDTLNSEGPFTVFAPTNAAFAALPAGTVETLLKSENKDQLVGILTAHVVSGKLKAADIIALAIENGGSVDVTTVSGDTLTAVLDGDTLFVRDENGGLATVEAADVGTSNGVVHVVGSVLLPVTAPAS